MNKKLTGVGAGLVVLVLMLAGLGWFFWKPRPVMTVEEIQEATEWQRLQLKDADAAIEQWKTLRQQYEKPTTLGEP